MFLESLALSLLHVKTWYYYPQNIDVWFLALLYLSEFYVCFFPFLPSSRELKSSTQNKNQEADWDSQNPTPPCPIIESSNFAPSSALLLPSGWGKSAILEAGLSGSCETRLSWQRNGMRKDTRNEGKCFPLLKCKNIFHLAKVFSVNFEKSISLTKPFFKTKQTGHQAN